MKKDKFRILNGLDNSKDKIDEINLSEGEKNSLKLKMRGIINEDNKLKNRKKKNRNKIIAASVSCIIIGTCILNSENVIASMTSLGKKIESYFGKEEDSLKPYKEEVLKSVEDKGITFSLNELILNDEELVVSMVVDYGGFDFSSIGIKESKEDKVDVYPNMGVGITLDGKKVIVPVSGGEYDYDVDNKLTNIIMNFDMEDADLGKDYKLNINLEQIIMKEGFKEPNIIDGNWSLDTDFSGKKLKDEVEVIKLNKTMDLKEYLYQDYIITEVRKTPASVVVKYEEENTNRIRKEGEKIKHLDLKFFDENGEKLDFISKGGSSDRGFSYEYKGDKELTKVKVVPVVFEERNAFLSFLGFPMKERVLEQKEFTIDLK
ncbi:DUF4179 domain-containing protein [Clostridium perfringens]|nr:DUF4179 domain-containing protein [Clostridium perfringens]